MAGSCEQKTPGAAHPTARPSAAPAAAPQALLALVGSTACVTFSFFFPAALVLEGGRGGAAARAGAVSMIALGAAMAVIAVYDQLTGRGE